MKKKAFALFNDLKFFYPGNDHVSPRESIWRVLSVHGFSDEEALDLFVKYWREWYQSNVAAQRGAQV